MGKRVLARTIPLVLTKRERTILQWIKHEFPTVGRYDGTNSQMSWKDFFGAVSKCSDLADEQELHNILDELKARNLLSYDTWQSGPIYGLDKNAEQVNMIRLYVTAIGSDLLRSLSPDDLLASLIEENEESLIEFKRYSPLDKNPADAKNRIAEAAVALANAAMLRDQRVGYLILGITDDKKAVGVKTSERYEKEYRDILEARSAPFLSVLKIHEASTKDLRDRFQPPPREKLSDTAYILEIEAGHYDPIRYYPDGKKQDGSYGGFPIRHGAKIRETTTNELRRLFNKGALKQKEDGGSSPGKGEDDRVLARRVLDALGG